LVIQATRDIGSQGYGQPGIRAARDTGSQGYGQPGIRAARDMGSQGYQYSSVYVQNTTCSFQTLR